MPFREIIAAQDESGDLGFDFDKKGTSRFFCITLVVSVEKRKLEKLVKRMFADFAKQRIKHPHGVLHAYNETDRTNHLMIRRLKDTDAKAFVIKVDKTKLIRRDIDEFYNDLTIMLLEKVFDVTGVEKVILIASRKDPKPEAVERFKSSLAAAYGDSLEVIVKRPREEKSLQVADCISWCLFRLYENGDGSFYQEIEPILHEYDY